MNMGFSAKAYVEPSTLTVPSSPYSSFSYEPATILNEVGNEGGVSSSSVKAEAFAFPFVSFFTFVILSSFLDAADDGWG